ncbi:MAG: NEW3 domain-containing protein [Candidatus Bathyarchaeia archaeon]
MNNAKFLLIFLVCISVTVFSINVPKATSSPAYVGLPAFNGGYEPAIIIDEPLGHCYDIYFRHVDYTRYSKEGRSYATAWTIVPGHEGYINLEIIKKFASADADYVCVDTWSDPQGKKSGITWQSTKQPYSPGQIVFFEFSVASNAQQGVYTVYMTLYKDISGLIGIVYSRFKVYFVVRSGADTPSPKIAVSWDSIPTQIIYGKEITVKFYVKNVGTEGARTANWDWWGNGLQIYLENGEFTREPKLTGYFPSPGSWGAYDYNDPSGRNVVGAPIIEVYDDFINIGGESETDIIEVYIRPKTSSGTLNIKIQAWMSEPDEWLWDIDHEGTLIYRYSPGATAWPFNGEWGGTPRFDDTAASSTPIAQITIISPKITVDPNGGRIFVDGNPITTRTTFSWAYGSTHTLDPDSGYSPRSGERLIFKRWREDGSSADPRTIVVSGDATYTAEWTRQYYLTMNVNPSGGGSVSPSSGWYDADTSVTIRANPTSGWAFESWTGSGSGSYSGSSNPATITMNAPITETANFYTFSLSVSPSGGSVIQGSSVSATVTVSLTGGTSSKTVSLSASGLPQGASASFSPNQIAISPGSSKTSTMTITTSTTTPEGAYNIAVQASSDVLSKKTTYTLTVNPATYTVTFYIKDDVGSTVYGASINFAGSSYFSGNSTSVKTGSYSLSTGTIPSGYSFKQWEVSGGISVGSATSSSTTATITGAGSITMRLKRAATITFSANGLDLDASGVVLTVDGISYNYNNLPLSFTWDVGSSHSFSWSDPISAGTNKRYVWTSTSGLSTAKSGTINVPYNGGSISATYKTQYTLTINVNPPGSGSTNPAVGTYWYDHGLNVPVSATASADYIFQKWQLDGLDYTINNTVILTMDGPHLLTAHFTKIQQTTHIINIDNYSFAVAFKSNSMISNVALNKDQKKLTFNVEGPTGTEGICNVTIPKELLNANPTEWNVLIDGTNPKSLTITWNQTHTFICFTYTHSTHLVEIGGTEVVSEFNSIISVLAFTALTTVTITVKKRKIKK